jgi:membrane fusion protein (multidrug efflux system)
MSTEPAPAHPEPRPPARRSPLRPRAIVLAAIIVAVLIWAARLLYQVWHNESTDDAYVSGHVHQISAQMDGQVAQVLVHENQSVQAGEVLVRLDPLAFQIAQAQARARVAQAQAGVAQARAGGAQANARLLEARARVAQAQAQIAQARAQATLASLTLARDQRMSAGNDPAVTPADLDAAQAAFDAARAAVTAAAAQETAAGAAVATAQGECTAAVAQESAAAAALEAARATQRDADRQAAYAEIRAPAAGTVGDRNVETGNRVQTGQQLFALVEPTVWVEANFKETQLARMVAGQPAEVTIDAIPGPVFHGRVESVAPASGAQYALLPADNATGNFTKVVQRVPVRIAFDPAEIRPFVDRLRPGLSAQVTVRVR